MKHPFLIRLLLAACMAVAMSSALHGQTIGNLTEKTTPASTDLIELEVPGSPAVGRRATLGNLAASILTINGTLAVNKGGTGQTTAQAAINSLMAASGSLAQGDIFFYNGTNVTKLSPGTSGYVLTTGGTGANPSWTAAGSSGSIPSMTGKTGQILTNNGSAANWTDVLDITKTVGAVGSSVAHTIKSSDGTNYGELAIYEDGRIHMASAQSGLAVSTVTIIPNYQAGQSASYLAPLENGALAIRPSSLSSQAGKVLAVNSGETALEFVSAPTASSTTTFTNKSISGSTNTLSNIGNSALTNSSVTVGSTSISLGGTSTSLAGLTTLGSTGLWTNTQDSLGTSTTPAATLQNTTAAASGAQQVSPSIRQSGYGWKTNATAASQVVHFQSYVLPVQGATAPTANWILQSAINGTTFANRLTVSSDSKVTIGSQGSSGYIADSSGGGGFRLGRADDGDVCFVGNYNTRGIIFRRSAYLSWGPEASDMSGQSADTYLGCPSAAVVEIGADAASAVAQTFKAADGSGTDKTGFKLTIGGGNGTGTGTGGDLQMTTTPPGASTGSSQNTAVPRKYVYAGEKSLTDATATAVVAVGVVSGKYAGGTLIATVHADDGTDYQSQTQSFTFAVVNKAGTGTYSLQATPSTSATAASSGTLTATWDAEFSGNVLNLRCNATSSLTETTLKVSWQILLNGVVGSVTPY